VLAAQYESFRDPLIILIALPTSMFGALIPLNAGLATINIYTQIGLVTLIGLISKHGILMVDFANKLQAEQGCSRAAAIEHAAAIRLRPILMTTAAMVVAMVPLLIARGAGAASRFDIGIVIAAGIFVGTLFTLFVTPAVYTFLAKDHQKLKAQAAAPASLGEIDAATDAGILFPGEPEPEQSEGHSAEVLAFTSAAKTEEPGQDKKGGRRPPKRKPLTPAAE
jgi:predicted RND superfamily exporter protein